MNKNKNKKAFTLVELLAVIVILAIILVIAVPKVMSVIEDSKKATLESTAKMIASSAEKAKVQNTVLGKTDAITCDSVAKINDLDYEDCDIDFDENTAKVTIKGKGKFANLNVCNGTKANAVATTEDCTVNTLVTHIKGLYEDSTTRLSNGLMKDNTVDENIRYSGSNKVVKNYVEFNNETWRIIGVFEVKTADGRTEELVKIIRDEPFKDAEGNYLGMSWDSSDSTINQGSGINEWSQADLQQMLNTYYIGTSGATCTYCNDGGQSTCENSCDSNISPINSTSKNMIENVVWNTGAINYKDPTIVNYETYSVSTTGWYNGERGIVGKLCSPINDDGSENLICNDTIERKTTWTGLVALPYGTDYIYATSESVCYTNMLDGMEYYDTPCKNNNWMQLEIENLEYYGTWMLSPFAEPDESNRVFVVDAIGVVIDDSGYDSISVRPSLYLKSNIQIADGDGSMGNPYKLSM